MDRLPEYLESLVLKRINKTGSCWIWNGKFFGNMPRAGFATKHGVKAINVRSYLYFNKIAASVLFTSCGNDSCVNPEHAVNNSDKTDDEFIKEYLHYDPFSGGLYWIKRPYKSRVKFLAGFEEKKDGYLIVKINKRCFKAHRVAWFLYYGEWPKIVIDHINGDRKDNRIENLRDVTHQENCLNRVSHREKGVQNVG